MCLRLKKNFILNFENKGNKKKSHYLCDHPMDFN
ncbi:hypothetical protein X975_06950, partial [Stegodyphus mimosarum]